MNTKQEPRTFKANSLRSRFFALCGFAMLVACLAAWGSVSGQQAYATEDTQAEAVSVGADEGTQTDTGMTYKVQAKSEAKAEKSADADASTAELVESEKDTQAVADELEKAEVSYDGFLALDVFFADADGNEVEPSEPVDVRFELPEGAVPEGAEDIAVHHLAEAEDGTVSDVEAVADDADATEGTVAVQDDATVDAEFTVESFSDFVISWNYRLWVTVHYVDENGEPIQGTQTSSVSLTNDEGSREFSDYAGEIPGYTYVGARLRSYDGETVTHVRAQSYTSWGTTYYFYTFYDGNQPRGQISASNNSSDSESVYLVYKTDGSEPEIPESNATVTTGKSAVKLADGSGNYELNLSVSGDRGQVDQQQKVDVLFILDLSNSMGESWGQNKRITEARNAISQITGRGSNVGLSDNESLDVRYALVGFAGGDSKRTNPYRDAAIRQNWTSSADYIYNEIPSNITYDPQGHNSSNIYGGGTNYEAGMRTGKDALSARDATRSDALVVTIFITDGDPTYYYTNSGATDGYGTQYDSRALQAGTEACEGLDTDYFYMVGVTDNIEDDVFTAMVDAVKVSASNKGSYSSADADQLLEAFADIQKQITFFDTQGVKMTDTLSDNADLVKNDDGSYSFTLELERRENAQSGYESVASKKVNVTPGGSGTKVTLSDGSQTVKMTVFVDVDASGKETIRVEFDDNYCLAQNYRYTVSSTIAPSKAAISAFEASDTNAYNGTGEEYTGTHANQRGFWSNDNANAKVDFTPIAVDDDDNVTKLNPDEAPFPKPVIQVDESLVTPPEPVKPDLHKYVKDNDDGTYDLNLDVHGDVHVDEGDKIPINILYVLDTSYSMIWPMDGNYANYPDGDEDTYHNNFERMKTAQAAIDALNGPDALGDTSKFDVRYALVTFNEQVRHTDSWTSDSSQLWKAGCYGGTPDFGSGTNYQAALTKARDLVASAPDDGDRADAQTIVVFLTDGEPNKPSGSAQSAAEQAASQLSCDQFYAVGVGQNQTGGDYRENLEGVVENVSANKTDLYVGTESEALVDYFKNIVHQITTVDCKNVVITDTLSDYAELADDAAFSVAIRNGAGDLVTVDGGPYAAAEAASGVTYTFKDGSSNTQTLTLAYDANAKRFTLTFPEDYALEAGWTYTVTTQIQPSDKAFAEFAESGYGNIVGDANTDDPDGYYGTLEDEWTSSEKPGFYANSEASLTYVSADQPQEDEYPKPVIQVNATEVSGVLQVLKNLEGDKLGARQFQFRISAVDAVKDTASKDSAEFAGWTENLTVQTIVNGAEDPDNIPLVHTGSDLTFDAGDIKQKYAYIYEEVEGDDSNYTYDKTAWKVVVSVERNDAGELVPYAQVYKDADGKDENDKYEWTPCDSSLKPVEDEGADAKKIKLVKSSDGKPAITIQFNNKVSKADLSITKVVAGPEGMTIPDAKFTVRVELKDEGGNPIMGEFSVKGIDNETTADFDENGAWEFEISADQTVTIEDLPVGATCKVTEPEDQIPGGFKLVRIDDSLVSDGKADARAADKDEWNGKIDPDGNDVEILNGFYGYGLEIFKGEIAMGEDGNILEDSEGNAYADKKSPLSGAEFEVYMKVSGDDGTETEAVVGTMKTGEDGHAVLEDSGEKQVLTDGTYYIRETKVPSGYQLLSYEIELTVKDGQATFMTLEDSPVTATVDLNDNGNFYYEIANKPNPDLPQSGSSGTLIMSSVGVATVILAGVYLLNRRFPLSK